MSIENREAAIKACLKWEGGYSNDPQDPGGPTNWGITIADAQKYWKKNADASDVKAMPLDIAVDIYRTKYWKNSYYDGDKLESGVDLAVFDFGVNSGPSRAKKYLDQSVGGTPVQTINNIFDKREDFLRGLSTFPTFGKGWLNRTRDLRKLALSMAAQPPVIGPKTKAVVATATPGVIAAMAAPKLFFEILAGTAGLVVLVWLGIHFYNKWKNK